MKRLICIITALALTPALGFAGEYRILSWDDASVTVEFLTGELTVVPFGDADGRRFARVSLPGFAQLREPGRPMLPARRFLFAVPSKDGVRLEILETDIASIEDTTPIVYVPEGDGINHQVHTPHGEAPTDVFAHLAGVGTYRHRTVASVDIFPVRVEGGGLLHARRMVIRLSFPAARRGGRTRTPRPSDHHIVNREQAAAWEPARVRPAQRTPFEFARSDDWIRITVGGKGLYVITYSDLLDASVNPLDIDPATVRLFSGGPLAQPPPLASGGSFTPDYHFTEHALLYRGGGGESFAPGDSLLFYAVGAEGWLTDLDPDTSRTAYYEHPYDMRAVYWLTWGGDFSGDPQRMDARAVAPQAPPVWIEVTSYEERIHIERDNYYDPAYTDDHWYWQRLKAGAGASFTHQFDLYDVTGSEGRIRSIGYGPYRSGMSFSHRATFYINGALVDTVGWNFNYTGGYHPEWMGRFDEPVTNLDEGRNTLFVRYENQLSYDEMYVFWYEVFYERSLRARQGVLDFFAPETAQTAQFTLTDLPSGALFLLDVTDYERPVLLTGFQRSGTEVLFEDDLDGTARHYRAVAHEALRSPGLARAYPPSLRDGTPPPHMVIIYHSRFRDAALRLRNHRATRLPYADQPVVLAIDIDDVYSNFSGGHKDPIAIRNYIKFLYDTYTDGGEPLLRYVLLLGNGTYDPRDLLGRGVDYVPFYMDIMRSEWEAIENESFLALLDDAADELPDIAIGRLPVLSPAEADIVSQRIIEYESNPEHGTWKNKVIMIADDEFSKSTDTDFTFIFDAEEMCSYTESRVLPRYLDIKKIYLRRYPFFGNVKPAAKADLLEEWNEGALVINYAGHGSPFQLADEKIFLKDDMYGLNNGVRAPLFLVFSCTVGDMESPYSHLRSIGQGILSLPQGGCIAVIASVAPTYATWNDLLNVEMLRALFVSEDSTATEPVGTALQLAKIRFPAGGRNSDKYTLIGDPALTLALPRYRVEHEEYAIDTMLTGNRYRVAGAVMRGNDIMTSFHGTAEVAVQEAELVESERVTWKYYPDTLLVVNIPGKELFRGSVDITAGRFDARFVVPRRCRTGGTARVRSYISSMAADGVGAVDSLRIMPAPPDSMRENLEAPLVKMFFAGQATKVKAGAQLIAEISDPDGIAILENDPQSSIFLEFDRGGFPVYVTEYFTYDHGSSTKGRVEYPLHSDINPGQHEVILRAFDNLGAAASDTLEFEVVEEGIYTVSDVYNFPNPFREGTNFMFQLSSRGDVQLRVYTVSGIEVWERRVPGEEGFNSIYWEGRDFTGDKLGNGTYLYILDVVFTGSYNRTERVTGKVVLLQ